RAHLAAGAAYVIKTSRAVLRRRGDESALRLRRRGSRRRRRRVQCRRSNRGGSDRLLRGSRVWRLSSRAGSSPWLCLLLRYAWRSPGWLRSARRRWGLDLLLGWRRLHLALLRRRRLDTL